MDNTFEAWAIETCDKWSGFIGRYWWFDGKPPQLPLHMAGCHVALFRTRYAARKGLPSVRQSYPNAKVRQVTVSISTLHKPNQSMENDARAGCGEKDHGTPA